MKTSESQTNISRALLEAHKEYPTIAKTKRGQQGNREFMYAPMEDVLAAIEPVNDKYGLLITQPVDGHNVITRLEHVDSGEWRESSMPINAEHANMQSYGIELTYRRRYAIQGMLGIITEEDTDGAGAQKRKGTDHTKQLNANGTERAMDGGSHSPKKIAFEALPVEVQNSFRKNAPQVESAMPDVAKAIEVASMLIDDWDRDDAPYGRNDLIAGFHYLLASTTRSAMKRHTQVEGVRAGQPRVTQ